MSGSPGLSLVDFHLYTSHGASYGAPVKHTTPHRSLARFGAAFLAAVPAGAALAQNNVPPAIDDLDKPATFLYYGAAFILLAATLVLSILPAKRRDQS